MMRRPTPCTTLSHKGEILSFDNLNIFPIREVWATGERTMEVMVLCLVLVLRTGLQRTW